MWIPDGLKDLAKSADPRDSKQKKLYLPFYARKPYERFLIQNSLTFTNMKQAATEKLYWILMPSIIWNWNNHYRKKKVLFISFFLNVSSLQADKDLLTFTTKILNVYKLEQWMFPGFIKVFKKGRTSSQKVFCKKTSPENFAKFAVKCLCL